MPRRQNHRRVSARACDRNHGAPGLVAFYNAGDPSLPGMTTFTPDASRAEVH